MIRVGTSGWTYRPWRGDFYPRGVRDELTHLSERLDTVEVNGTFYGPRKESDYLRWRDVTPEGFVFAVKGPREVTHSRRLREVSGVLDEFYRSGVLELGPKLGPVLWQIPASLRYDEALISDFLDALPDSTRHAFEVRHDSFYNDTLVDQLTARGVALVVADNPGVWPCLAARTTDFTYLRLHGDTELYTSRYTDTALDKWATLITEWHTHGDVYAYLDNTMNGAAPWDAVRLAERTRRTTD
ncbi:DUF72 domain-containing protein [Actinokineospora globicatena]|uniref:DUF72 domain-containing protein n=1 Tax=Actinokineospora globicatena TaxID=103729 RepID=A0A9W6QMS8_9PSEU|nr:DUF72 domain-containing protein [Actinokineospora globicatena]GLW91424.1 hypothetical protein Aglo03_22400 [Actinokineospora globicatena]